MTTRWLRFLLIVSLGIVTLLPSCSKKKAIQVGEFESYQDPIYGFGISYPKDWAVKEPETGKRFTVYSSFDARDRFLDITGSKRAGVYLAVGVDSVRGLTLDSYVEEVRKTAGGGFTYDETVKTTLQGTEAIKMSFHMPIDKRDTIYGYVIRALKNNMITHFEAAGFNELFDDYKIIFDTALTTVRLGEPRAAKSKEDISKPAEVFDTYNGKFLDISYPTNFEYKFPQKPNTDIVMEFKGYRQDCTMSVEVSDAKNLTLDKVVAQNETIFQKVGYKIKKKANATIDGNRAALIDLTYSKGEVDSRAYFSVKGNKMYYIFLTWYRPQANVYVPVFERMVASLKIK